MVVNYLLLAPRNLKSILTFVVMLVLSACFTPAKEREIKNDIFSLQTRLLQLETGVQEGTSSGEAANKRIASQSADMERLSRELQKIRGDIDALRVGVTTGQMPGQEASSGSEKSVAQQLRELNDRLIAIETNQTEILNQIGSTPKVSKHEDTQADKAKHDEQEHESSVATTLGQLQKNFDRKKFKSVIDDAPNVIKTSAKPKDKSQAQYLFAESLFKSGKHREAALEFNNLLDMKPSKKLLLTSKLRMGDCFRALNDSATARLYYEELADKHAKTPEGEKAKERLREIKGQSTAGKSEGMSGHSLRGSLKRLEKEADSATR